MTNTFKRWLGACALLAAALHLGGCAAPKPLYAWGSYQAQVYTHFKGQGSPEQQILDLEKDMEEAKASGTALPPGYHAHLGLLYMSVGKGDQAVQAWNTEKALFPESTKYIDFLLNNMKKNGA